MFFFDWTYILVIIGALICILASSKVKSTYAKYSKVPAASGMSGRDAAKKILEANGIYGVTVNMISGDLTDHYDPTKKVLNLSTSVYTGTSIAAISVAAHECGHAIQDSVAYTPLKIRSSLVPVANFGSMLAWPMIFIGLILGMTRGIGGTLFDIGIIAFSLAVLFQIVTLPVEFNASKRALVQLKDTGILDEEEDRQAYEVLRAAALTYVASAASSILQLLRLIIIRRDSE